MKLLLLGAANSIHLQRWANALAEAGIEVHVASQHPPLPTGWQAAVRQHALPVSGGRGYAANAWALRRLMRQLRADLLHAHYASGYGLLATLAGCRPRLVSAWGSDVFEFPDRSPLHRALLRQVLRRADALACTSRAMRQRILWLLGGRPQEVAVTPFGVDVDVGVSVDDAGPVFAGPRGGLCVGTVKGLAPVYGVDLLIRAFARLAPSYTAQALRLRLVGDGPQRAELQALAVTLGVGDRVDFVGAVPHAQVPAELRRLDVFVAASRQESFGVAVLEASAAGLPVVATRVGGLPEVVDPGVTGLLVAPDDVPALAGAIAQLLDDGALRQRMGRAGRDWVAAHYAWPGSVQTMLALYRRLLPGHA
jgi:glycosyltransferase involved in cell wall biosynthesis